MLEKEDVNEEMEIKPDMLKFESLITEFKEQKIRIPEFQRDFVWDKNRIKKLLDSIYKQFPIGSFILWECTEKIKCVERIGNYEFENEPPKGYPIKYVIDGQQRILSLIAAIKGATIDDKKYEFYFDLEENRFLNKNEISEDNKRYVPLKNIFFNKIDYSNFIDYYEKKHRQLLNELYLRFNDYQFSVIYVRNENKLKNICDVFHVINTTGKKLSPVALVISKSWSEGYDLRKKFNEMHEKFNDFGEIPEYRILQLAAVILHEKQCKKNIIIEHLQISKLKELWDDLIKSLERAIDFVINILKIKHIRYIPFDIIIVPLAYFYYKNNMKRENPTQKELLKKWFWFVGLSRGYDSAVEGRIEKDLKEFDKILNGKEPLFSYSISWDKLKESIMNEKFSLNSAFCKTILSLYSYNNPLNFSDSESVQFSSYSSLNKKNLHHVFPRKYIKDNLPHLKEYTHKVVNLCFIPADQNIEISADPPKEYFDRFKIINKKFNESLESHFITDLKDFGIEENDFEKFLEKRANIIKKTFEKLIKK